MLGLDVASVHISALALIFDKLFEVAGLQLMRWTAPTICTTMCQIPAVV
jgi:hypothetical protein